MFGVMLDMQDIKIEKLLRLGKGVEGRSRPLLIKVESEESKWEILRSARKLRSSNEFRNVYVNKDLIKEDREKEKKIEV